METLHARRDHLIAQRSAALARRIGEELRIIRVNAGLIQADVGRLAGLSQPTVSRLERGVLPMDLDSVVAVATALGRSAWLRLFPRERVRLRDSGQLTIAGLVVAAAHPSWRFTMEQPVAPGDPRAADLLGQRGDEVAHLEIERSLADLQAQLRAGLEKRSVLAERERRPVRFVMVLPDAARSRDLVARHRELIETTLPLSSRHVWSALRHGGTIGGDGILWVRERELK